MKIGFLITARLKSVRLPKKLLLKVENREFIRWMLDRIKLAKSIEEIIICTSTNSQDDPLETVATEEGVLCFRGDENDVLNRLYEASVKNKLDYVVNITADCPLVSVEYIEKTVKIYKETGADMIRALGLPHGFYSYGLKIDALKKVCEIKKGKDTEVWGRYFTDTGMFNVKDIKIPGELKRPNYRLTLDYQEDYEFFKVIYRHFGKMTYSRSIREIIDFIDNHPDVAAINSHCEERYKKRFDIQDKIEL